MSLFRHQTHNEAISQGTRPPRSPDLKSPEECLFDDIRKINYSDLSFRVSRNMRIKVYEQKRVKLCLYADMARISNIYSKVHLFHITFVVFLGPQ